MNEILAKATLIINEAQNDRTFHSKYFDKLIGTGDSSADYSIYKFELSEDDYLLTSFSDFSFDNFSIVHKYNTQLIEYLASREKELEKENS